MDKLYYYAVQGTSLDLLRSYLVKRKQYVQIGGVKSDITYLSTGVPQGSILGPLLFIIYINDIAKCSNLLHTIIYADDTTLMGNISTFELRNGRTLDENIHFELLKLTDWLTIYHLPPGFISLRKEEPLPELFPQTPVPSYSWPRSTQVADKIVSPSCFRSSLPPCPFSWCPLCHSFSPPVVVETCNVSRPSVYSLLDNVYDVIYTCLMSYPGITFVVT